MAVEYRRLKAIENGTISGNNNVPTKESNQIIKEASKHEARYQKNNMRQGMRHNKMQFHFVLQTNF